MALIEVRQLSYTYPTAEAPALQAIDLDIQAGQLVALVGPNGAGKSTLCLALAGLIPALFHGTMRGQATVCGLDTRQHSPAQFAGRVGLVLQNPANQLSGMCYSVYEEVAFGLENLGLPPAEMPARIEAALQQVGLSDLRRRSPYALSGGQQQRLALASVLALQPDVLLLDEPTAMLDPQGAQTLLGVVQRLARTGVAVVLVEHQFEWLARAADRALLLAGGRLLLDGPPAEVLSSPLLPQHGAGWLRYTQAAAQGRALGLWPAALPLPVTLEQAAAGFQSSAAEAGDANTTA